ncbi:BTAD domain-containing putative transcriptional regulator [Kitasatospora sp. NPDC058032]|uniref:AfsR/SARP family transcriptional regulator n=1 Tax=Kitasatospora sp. NPDC058032 TaxID=3346307 RepID=UPI0036D7CF7D
MADDVWFEVLGPVRVRRGQFAADLGPPRQRAVLAVLLLNSGRPVRTERIVQLVWGADAPGRSVNLVQKYVSGLRRALAGLATLAWTDAGYVLAAPGTVDVERFEELLVDGRARRTNGDAAGGAEAFTEAVALWRGPLAQGVDGPGIEPLRLRLAEARLGALEDLFDLELELGRLAGRIPELRRLAAEHPLRERFQAQLVLALAQSGRQAESLEVYERVRRLLADEHGLDPGPHLRAAQERVLRLAPADPPAPAEVRDRPQVPVPVPTAGAVEPAQPPAPPAPRTIAPDVPRPAQLPLGPRGFTGRREHIDRLAELLRPADGTLSLVCLEGTAGVGKTALALHVAHRAAPLFADGQLFADLHGHGRAAPAGPAEVLGGFLRALGVPAERVPQGVNERIGLYRSLLAGRSVLVVLDNARDADQVRPLLPGGGGSTVLVTSRRRLVSLTVREGAHRLVVPVLPAAEAHRLVTALLQPGQGDDTAAVDEIVRLCAGLPLALRIVAANAAYRSDVPLGRIARELTVDRVAALSAPDEAQTALAGSLGLSYDLLRTNVRTFFCLLGLVPGPDFTVNAAATMAGSPPATAERQLRELEVANLLERVEDRYRFPHELLQLFAHERAHQRLTAGERTTALGRLFGWYVATAAAAGSGGPAPRRSVDQAGVVTPETGCAAREGDGDLSAEFANLTAAVRYAAEHGPLPVAWQLADALRPFCKQHARLTQWSRLAESGLAAARQAGDRRAEAVMLINLSDANHNSGRITAGEDYARQALALAGELGRPQIAAAALDQLGRAAWIRGHLAEARTLLTEAVELHTRNGDPLGLAVSLAALARTEFDSGNRPDAYRHYTRCLRLARTIGSDALETMALAELGMAHAALGRPGNAVQSLRAALSLGRTGSHRRAEALVLAVLSRLHAEAGRTEEAHTAAREALHAAESHGDSWTEAECLNATGAAALATDCPATAAARYGAALTVAGRLGYRRAELHALVGLAEAALQQGDAERAADLADRAHASASALGYRPLALTAQGVRNRLPAEPGRAEPDSAEPDSAEPDDAEPDGATRPSPLGAH